MAVSSPAPPLAYSLRLSDDCTSSANISSQSLSSAPASSSQFGGDSRFASLCCNEGTCNTRQWKVPHRPSAHRPENAHRLAISLPEASFRDTQAAVLAGVFFDVQGRRFGCWRGQQFKSSVRLRRFMSSGKLTSGRSAFARIRWENETVGRNGIPSTLVEASGCFPFISPEISNGLFVAPCTSGTAWKSRFLQEAESTTSCKCSTVIGELGSAVALEWKPAADQLLLLSSIALAYIAGIVTPAGPVTLGLPNSSTWRQKKISKTVRTRFDEFQKVQDTQGQSAEQSPLQEEDIWNGARAKLLTCIRAVDSLGDEKIGQCSQLSLQAVANGPQLRLLLTTLDHLHKEICNLQSCRNPLESDWTQTSSKMLCEMVVPICTSWLLEERLLKLKDPSSTTSTKGVFVAVLGSLVPKENKSQLLDATEENALSQWKSTFSSQLESLQGNKIIVGYLERSGKTIFYADFLHFLCFGSVRIGSCCNVKALTKHTGAIVEDLVIALADGAAALYLELISADSTFSESEWSNVMVPSISSTRALERFRNEVALCCWVNENFASVTAMFEDRFDLWILKTCNFEFDQLKNHHFKWSSKTRVDKFKSTKGPVKLVLDHFELPVKRTRELRALSGWRYYYSLYLELSDVMGPLLRTIVTKLGEGISFLLVFFIGRSLGLIYRGIRQSIRWTSD